MYVPVYVPVLIFGFYRKNPYIRGIYENVRIMSAKLIGFTAFALLSGGVLFCSCGGNSSAFITNLRNFSADKEITEVEYASLKGFLQRTPKGFDVGGTHISTEADLVSYLHSQGITSSAKALAVMPDVTFDSLQVYLENSASMKGYSNAGNPNFTAPVIALFNVGDPDTQIVTGYVGASASGEAALSPVERSKFESNLANGRIATAVSSPIDRIISLAVDSTSPSSVSCIITDGILSGSNSEIHPDGRHSGCRPEECAAGDHGERKPCSRGSVLHRGGYGDTVGTRVGAGGERRNSRRRDCL